IGVAMRNDKSLPEDTNLSSPKSEGFRSTPKEIIRLSFKDIPKGKESGRKTSCISASIVISAKESIIFNGPFKMDSRLRGNDMRTKFIIDINWKEKQAVFTLPLYGA
ncbi:hypothetical protein ACFL1N_17265, partial [Thermodesulfobacteriota bacterium]